MSYANAIQGSINGLFFAGEIFGALLVMALCDKIGRKKTAAIACILVIIGGVLLAASVHIAMFLVARLITGVGAGAIVIQFPFFNERYRLRVHVGFLLANMVSLVTGYKRYAHKC